MLTQFNLSLDPFATMIAQCMGELSLDMDTLPGEARVRNVTFTNAPELMDDDAPIV